MPRIREQDLILPALEVLATAPGGFASTAQLIAELDALFVPDGIDAELLEKRTDTYFSQKVRNLVSHRANETGLGARGLAIYDPERRGWTITARGSDLVATVYR